MNKRETMRVYIDNRERSLLEILPSLEVPHSSKPLDIGDIDILGPKGQRFLLERKTLPDLAASLRDGRFKSQKDRLLGVLQREPATAIAYVVEGILPENDHQKISGRVTVGTIRTLLNTIQLRYRIPVITTRNVRGTAILVRSIYRQLVNKPEFAPVGSGGNEGCAGHADVMPQIKKNTKDDNGSVWTSMLTAIRGISQTTSSRIVSHFENIHPEGLIHYVRENDYTEFRNELDRIRHNNRRIPKKSCERISRLFYPNTREPAISEDSTTSSSSNEHTTNHREAYNPGIVDVYTSGRVVITPQIVTDILTSGTTG